MRVAMVFPGILGELPPAITAALMLQRIGEKVAVIAAGCEVSTRKLLRENSVDCLDICLRRYPRSVPGKTRLRLLFGLHLCGSLRALHPQVVWYHTAHAMEYRRLARWLAPQAVTVAHAHELYDKHARLRALQEQTIAASACWIAPERNRAELLRTATCSQAPHWVVPNRPLETLGEPPSRGAEALEIFQLHGGSPGCRRFVIYQGLIAESRCLLQAAEAFRRIRRPDVGLIILGDCRDRRFAATLRAAVQEDGRIVVVDRIPPPLHLRVTAGADVGLLLYAPTSLNHLFCAPGKLFEYAWCGLGVVMSASPSLTATTEPVGLGQSCDPLDPASIRGALESELDRDPDERRRAAAAFLRSSPSPLEIYGQVGACLKHLVGETGGTN